MVYKVWNLVNFASYRDAMSGSTNHGINNNRMDSVKEVSEYDSIDQTNLNNTISKLSVNIWHSSRWLFLKCHKITYRY